MLMQVLAGDDQDLVLHIYAAGSQIDTTINQQTKTQIAATSEVQIDTAEEDDPAFSSGNVTDSDIDATLNGLGNGTTDGATNSSTNGATNGATNSATNGATNTATNSATNSGTSAPASVVQKSSTFNYVACESDSTTARTLSSLSWAGTELTVQRCAAYCAEYKYMGVEFGSQ